MKKILSYGFVIAVLLLSVTLTAGMLLAGPAPAGANERLSAAPALTDKDGKLNPDVLSDTAAWVNDHFFLRQELISANNDLSGKLFGVSGTEDVLLGLDGWLYYSSTLDDYTGVNTMTDREIWSAARNVALMEEYCRAQGKTFAFTVAPNKNSLYSENMPAYTVVETSSNAKRFQAYLTQFGVNFADLFTAFAGEDETLYFAHDSHWNSKGAALGADTINAALGRESSYYTGDFSQSQPHAGDLYEMAYPAFADTEQDPVYGGTLDYTFTSNATKPDSITLLTAGNQDGSLLCYRDSFGNLLYPYLADSFGSCRFSRSTTYDLTQEGDFVVIELVERNLNYLTANPPIFPAPRRDMDVPEATGTVSLEISDGTDGMVLAGGTLPETPDSDSPIYIVCAGGVYEATCLKDNGFAAYLPAGESIDGVACYAGGALKLFAAE